MPVKTGVVLNLKVAVQFASGPPTPSSASPTLSGVPPKIEHSIEKVRACHYENPASRRLPVKIVCG